MDIRFSKNFRLSQFVDRHVKIMDMNQLGYLQRVCRNVLEPIQLRFGNVSIEPRSIIVATTVKFYVHNFKSEIILDYIKEELIHSYAWLDEQDYIYVLCEGDV